MFHHWYWWQSIQGYLKSKLKTSIYMFCILTLEFPNSNIFVLILYLSLRARFVSQKRLLSKWNTPRCYLLHYLPALQCYTVDKENVFNSGWTQIYIYPKCHFPMELLNWLENSDRHWFVFCTCIEESRTIILNFCSYITWLHCSVCYLLSLRQIFPLQKVSTSLKSLEYQLSVSVKPRTDINIGYL